MAHLGELPALSDHKDKPYEPIGQLVERHTVGVERNITGLTALRDDLADTGVTQGCLDRRVPDSGKHGAPRDWVEAEGRNGTKSPTPRWLMMNKTIEELQRDMEAAAHALDFEEARRIRDRINLMRGGANATEAAEADTSGLVRQRSGAMGLGSSRQRPVTPPDWTAPPTPDPMTSGRTRK